MQIRLFFSICALLFSITSLAATNIDSIGIENINGKKIILHKVEPKESYYSISRKYEVNVQALVDYNNNKSLQPGSQVKVPTDQPFSNRNTNNKNLQNASAAMVEYKVGPKETLFAISRKFNTSVEEIKELNNLNSNSLSAGQIIKVRYGNNTSQLNPAPPVTLNVPKNISDGRQNAPNQIDSSINAGERLRLPPARYGLREVDERGVAVWIADESIDKTKMLALHRSAPIGTVVKITNPMTGRSTFAKIVGKFTENESTKDVIIVLTKATADLVGALDKRFQVNLVYGVPNE